MTRDHGKGEPLAQKMCCGGTFSGTLLGEGRKVEDRMYEQTRSNQVSSSSSAARVLLCDQLLTQV